MTLARPDRLQRGAQVNREVDRVVIAGRTSDASPPGMLCIF